jgi:probable HAF family extracellular repeat protein
MRVVLKVNCWTGAWALTLLSLGLGFFAQAQQSELTDPAAQDGASPHHPHGHHHYKLIDLGTFGGVGSTTPEFQQVLNNEGTAVGGADTRNVNPAPNCFNPFNASDCYVQHAFVWQSGELTDLGTLAGGSSSFAYWINAEGVIAGGSELRDIDPNSGMPEYHAVLWRDRKIHDLGTLGGTSSLAVAVNNFGQIAGFAQNAIADSVSLLGLGTQTRAFLWSNGKMHDLGTLGGADSFAQYVNDRGQVAGVSYTNEMREPKTGFPQLDPFLWEDGRMKDLGNFGGTNALLGPFIFGLNNRGQVVGYMALPGDVFIHAFLWDGRKLSDLGTFLGGDYSVAYGINDTGEVIGAAWLPGDLLKHAVLWRNGIMTDLGTVNGDPCSVTESINSRGQVVGASQSAAGGCDKFTSAFLWENGGPMVDLNTLVAPGSTLQLDGASQINDRGEITGRGVPPGCDNSDVCGHAYVLIPCDEDHADIEGCNYDMVDSAAADAPSNSAPVTDRLAAATSTQPAPMLRRLSHIPGVAIHSGVSSPRSVTVTDAQSPAAQKLTITSGTPPQGTVGKAYDVHCHIPLCGGSIVVGFPLAASGGVPPYSWTWTPQAGSSLPPSLSISHHFGLHGCVSLGSGSGICGTPTIAGSYNVTVKVTDSASPPAYARANYTMDID